MRTISTGQPSTVGTYFGISRFFGEKAQAFMQEYMDKSGPDEEIIAEESQMLYLLANLHTLDEEQIKAVKQQTFGDNDELFTI